MLKSQSPAGKYRASQRAYPAPPCMPLTPNSVSIFLQSGRIAAPPLIALEPRFLVTKVHEGSKQKPPSIVLHPKSNDGPSNWPAPLAKMAPHSAPPSQPGISRHYLRPTCTHSGGHIYGQATLSPYIFYLHPH